MVGKLQLKLNSKVTTVYEKITEFLKIKRALNIKNIIPHLEKNIKEPSLTSKEIKKILRSLLKKRIVVEGSQLTKEDIFRIPKRSEIFQYIENNPGTYPLQITQNFNFSSRVVQWHLKILNDFDFVRIEEFDNHKIYFTPKVAKNKVKRYHYLRNDKCKRIINLISKYKGGMTKTGISNALSMHHHTVVKYTNILHEINILNKKKTDNKTVYCLNKAQI